MSAEKLSQQEASTFLARLYQIFGKAVFLVLAYGSKKFNNREWEKITFADTQTDAYQRKLLEAVMRGGNLAVRLGPLSDGLRAIDVDIKERVSEFRDLNPALSDTATVYGLKGAQIFGRQSDGFVHRNPAVDKLKTADGQEFGEWRHGQYGGAYSMIYGQHPDDPLVSFKLEGIHTHPLDFNGQHWAKDLSLPWFIPSENWQKLPDWVIPPAEGIRRGTYPDEDIRWKPPVPGPETVIDNRTMKYQQVAGNAQPKSLPESPGVSSEKEREQKQPESQGVSSVEGEERIKAYLETRPPSISGQDGDQKLFDTACEIMNGFVLSIEQTVAMLSRYFNPRCQPPWPEQRLRYKAEEAAKAPHKKPRGYLLIDPQPAAYYSGETSRERGGEGNEGNEENNWDFLPSIPISPSIPSIPSGGVTQKAPFPKESILANYHDYAITQSQGADAYLMGGILPVAGSFMQRNVYTEWANGIVIPNLFSLLVGPPGNMKSTSIELPEEIARRVFGSVSTTRFLPRDYSPQSLFDAYLKHPHRLLVCDDANATLFKWQTPGEGEKVSSLFLSLFDGRPLSETYRGNRKDKLNLDSQERFTELTSTSVVFGVTFNGCEFRGNSLRDGLQRRFSCYVAEDIARKIKRPKADEEQLKELTQQFSLLSYLRGPCHWQKESEILFDAYSDQIEERIKDCDLLDDQTRGRLRSACAWVLKVTMIFEASCLCYNAKWNLYNPPEIVLRADIMTLAIEHVDACLEAAASLGQVANRKRVAENAQLLLAYVRNKLSRHEQKGAIILTRSQLTDSYAHNASRRSNSPVSDIYDLYLPYLIAAGDAKLIFKEGKKEIYAFRVE